MKLYYILGYCGNNYENFTEWRVRDANNVETYYPTRYQAEAVVAKLEAHKARLGAKMEAEDITYLTDSMAYCELDSQSEDDNWNEHKYEIKEVTLNIAN